MNDRTLRAKALRPLPEKKALRPLPEKKALRPLPEKYHGLAHIVIHPRWGVNASERP